MAAILSLTCSSSSLSSLISTLNYPHIPKSTKPIRLCQRKLPFLPTSSSFGTRGHRCYPLILNEIEPDPEEEEGRIGVKAALSVLKFYKREISPLLPKSCRYVPSCSEYSMIAYKKYGFAKGSVLTVWRICRCNPIGGSGFDPPRWFNEERVPEEEE